MPRLPSWKSSWLMDHHHPMRQRKREREREERRMEEERKRKEEEEKEIRRKNERKRRGNKIKSFCVGSGYKVDARTNTRTHSKNKAAMGSSGKKRRTSSSSSTKTDAKMGPRSGHRRQNSTAS